MNKLYLKNFKAFFNPVEIDFDSKNALIYGENGSGKSSIYEAIRLWFYTNKIFSQRCDNRLTSPADIQNNRKDILDSYNHQKLPGTRFTMTLDGIPYSDSTTPTGYNVCMINRTNLEIGDSIELVDLLKTTLVGIDDPSEFITTKQGDIKELINTTISKEFNEPNIEVNLLFERPKWYLTIKDNQRQLQSSRDLSVFYNEGKLHIIILIFLLTAAQLNEKREPNKLLVLDDIITSLDAANRTFLIKYIHDYLGDWQKIIMTHSPSFFNQIDNFFRKIWREDNKWKSYKLLEHKDESSIYTIDDLLTGKELRKQFERRRRPNSLPNDIRKRFEYLVAELSGLLSIGGITETGQIIKAINASKDYYYYFDRSTKSGRNTFDMVDEIISNINASPTCTLKTNLETVINKYKSQTELTKLHEILQSLMIYQKVTMHAGSHSSGLMTPLTTSEMDRCISLIQYLEILMGQLVEHDMYSF